MLNAVFARPIGIFDNWFNKVVSVLTLGDYCHSEFVFRYAFNAQLKRLRIDHFDLYLLHRIPPVQITTSQIQICT